jgi:metal-responsive CopG/Arc/MetJ family transcriptional regulator
MSVVSIKLPDELLSEADKYAHLFHKSRADYFRSALEELNLKMKHKALAKKLHSASLKVRKQSLKINQEFSD